jgi:hypothetical protein
MSSVWFPPAGVNRGLTPPEIVADAIYFDLKKRFVERKGQSWKGWVHGGWYELVYQIRTNTLDMPRIQNSNLMPLLENENLRDAMWDLLLSLYEMQEARLAKFDGMSKREVELLNEEIGQKFDHYDLIRKLVVEDEEACAVPRLI